jgi:YfiH family protein
MKIEKIEKDNTIIFTSLELRKKYKILLFFTSKKGGYSSGKYRSLNLGYHVEDDPENVSKNRNKVLNLFGCGKTAGLFSLNQIHSDKIFNIDDKFIEDNPGSVKGMPDSLTPDTLQISADGLITNISMIPLMVMAADCNLILMADIKKRVIGAVHAGWKGVLKKIELNAINMFKSKYDSDLKDILVFIGPSIRKCCFKVTRETLNLFFNKYKNNLPVEKLKNGSDDIDYYFIDLVKIIKNNLINSGIPKKNIFDLGLCTFCNEDNLFFSYRKERKTGRHAGIIMLE